MDEKWDLKEFPFHMHMDVNTKNENIEKGKELCKRCEGTGNELFSMYKKCSDCDGEG